MQAVIAMVEHPQAARRIGGDTERGIEQRLLRPAVRPRLGRAVDDRAVADLRRTRQRRRLGDTDWYDIAYRVYLFAPVGLTLVVWVSDAIDGALGDDGIAADDLLYGRRARP